MFKEIVKVNILDLQDKQKYINRAIELGYTIYVDRSYNDNRYYALILYPNEKRFNILCKNIVNLKTITQEEFFGVNKLEKITDEVLKVLVDMTCETLDSFSSYDVTKLLRNKLPNTMVLHNSVREHVLDYVKRNNLNDYDNGIYHVYSKQKTNCCQSKPQIPNLQKINSTTIEEVDLQTEYRINLTDKIKKHFPGVSQVYVKSSPSEIKVSETALFGSILRTTSSEIRLRTGFKTPKVKIVATQGLLRIQPLK